uniref:Uncharacterized protein n=1 Tax=Prolemur simus TaxID=1328070 RepID=A0A8C8YRE2_PROSS
MHLAECFAIKIVVKHFYFFFPQESSEQLAFVTLLAKGDTLKISERRSVAITSEEKVTFIQADKPIYKSGDEGKIIFSSISDCFYFFIIFQDPQNNRISQWKNVTSFQNITQLSFRLTSEPMFGDYSIVVKRQSGKTVTHQFTVKQYVLPRFEVKVSAPQTVTITDEEFQVGACATYTYGQPVQGKAQIRVCREYFPSGNCETNNEICEQFIVQVHTMIFTQKKSSCVQISEKTSISITQFLGSVNFENMDSFYRRGIPYFGTIKFSGPSDVPMVSKLLQLNLNNKFIGNYTTDENGEAQFAIDTSDIFDQEFNLQVRPQRSCYLPSWLTPHYTDAYFSASRFYSRTSSFLKIVPEPKQLRCNQQKIVTVHYSLDSKAYKDDSNVNFFYLGSFSFPINISADLAPVAVMFVYTLHPSGEIVADSVEFQIDKCFKNKVSIRFSEERGLPGSNASLYLQAAPDSLCALGAVDKSVLFLKSEQQLSAESVYNLLPNIELHGYFYDGLNLDDGKVDPCIPEKEMFYNGLYCIPTNNHRDGDIYSIIRVKQAIIETVRTNFPETWIWDLVSVDSSGSANLSFLIPDTITQWKANGFCVHGDAGFGISSTVTLDVSQSFFVEIASPSSVVQNEQFDLIVSVFSYLDTCVEGPTINVTYIWGCIPGEVTITAVAESKQSSACPQDANEQQNLNWKDTVVKSLLVEVRDFLGLAVQNLDDPLQISYRNAEQNVALLASNTYVLDYLQSTEQLTEELKSQAFSLLSKGYQNQLSFKNSDGSYDIFWSMNREGSIWLSALTFKTLERMKKYVFIDENVQKQTLIWLLSKQKSDGCFENDGKFFSNFSALQNGLFCLEEAVESGVANGYNHAILAYVFALAGKEEQAESLLQMLDQSARKTNNVIYWEREKKAKTKEFPPFIPWAPSAETEKTCYVLLAVISRKNHDLTYASKIVQWLAQQMDSHGSFSPIQVIDMVCLLAITLYKKLTFSNDQNTVTFSSEGSNEVFQVNSENRLLVQRSELTKAHGQYTVDVEGQGLFFSFFKILRYTGVLSESNMVLVDVKMLSGFTPVMSSIEEVNHRSPIFQTPNSFTFFVEQSNLVWNIQPAPVMVYNYYEKGRQAMTML